MQRSKQRIRGGAGGGSSSPFTPASISGLTLWLDASDATTIHATGSVVDTWDDKSGNANNLTSTSTTRPTTGTRTINSLNVLDYDGSNDNMVIPSGCFAVPNGANTLFAVFQSDNTGDATQYIIIGLNAGAGIRQHLGFTATDLIVQNRSTSNLATTQALVRDTSVHTVGYRRSGTSIEPFIAGTLGTAGTNAENFTATTMTNGAQTSGGGAGRFNGLLAEVIWYNSSLSDADMDNVGSYLETKWGSSWTNLIPSTPASALTADDAGAEVYYSNDSLADIYLTAD